MTFLALCLDQNQIVVGVLVAEAKFHTSYKPGISSESHAKLSKEGTRPVDLAKFKELLRELYGQQYQPTVESIQKILFSREESLLNRTDVFLYAFEKPHANPYPPSRIDARKKDRSHNVKRPFHVFELQLNGASQFALQLYDEIFGPVANSGEEE
ncbi:MAG: hypothetical protein IPJ84_01530 [Bdellovibrionales bacterium]|nr:hypothetical protein [Bdellovibrionales bacterium]